MKEMGANSSSQENQPLIDNTNNLWEPRPNKNYKRRIIGWVSVNFSL